MRAISILSAGYYRLITWVGELRPDRRDPEYPPQQSDSDEDLKTRSYENLDAEAVAAADKYRGTGIAIALLGLGVVIAELVASGAGVGATWQIRLMVLKFLLMVCILLIAIWAIQCDLRGDFIRLRAAAEKRRFSVLKTAADALSDGLLAEEKKTEIRKLLDDQHRYQILRAERYRSMTWISNRLTWLLFVFAMAAAGFHCVALTLYPDLLRAAGYVGTAAAIALAVAAAVQSINAFLRLEGQRHEARGIADYLEDLRPDGMRREVMSSPEKLREVYERLMQSEQQWVAESRRSGGFRPG